MKRPFLKLLVLVIVVASYFWWKSSHRIQTQSFSSGPEAHDKNSTSGQSGNGLQGEKDSPQTTGEERKPDSTTDLSAKSSIKNLADLQKRFPKGDFKLLKSSRGDVDSMTGETDPYAVGVDGAFAFLSEATGLFGIDDPSQLRKPSTEEKLAVGSRTTFEQFYEGIEVWGANVAIFQNDAGQVWLVNNGFVNGVSGTPTQATLPYGIAKQFVIDDAGLPIDGIETRTNAQGEAVPVIINNSNGIATLSWMLQIAQNAKGAVWLYFVDARSPAGAPRFTISRRNTAVH